MTDRSAFAPRVAKKLLQPKANIPMKVSLWERTPPKGIAFTVGFASVLVLGVIDYLTGYQVSIFVFYGIPILAVAWFVDSKRAILLSLIAGLTWWWADQLAFHAYRWNWLEAWETMVRLSFFIFTAVSGTVIRAYYEATKSRIELLEHSTRLEQQIVQISEQEQQRIGQDLHDGICQCLAALGYSAASLQKDLQEAGHAAWASSAKDLAERLNDTVAQTRDLARGLMPAGFGEDVGLTSALEELAASSSRLLKIDCLFEDNCENVSFDPAAATHLYRIAQEAINNATRHGKASRVEVCLSSAGSDIELRLEDNGTGIDDSAAESDGMGLEIMRSRARCIGADLHIGTRSAGGTVIRCLAPASLNSN